MQESPYRVAVCFSGGVRNFKDTFSSFNVNFLKVYHPDIFIYGKQNNDGVEVNLEDITNLYNPRSIVINDDAFYAKEEFKHSFGAPTLKSLFFNVHQCNILKQEYESRNNFIYDIVLRVRFDCFFNRVVDKEELSQVNDNTILVRRDWCGFSQSYPTRVCDIFAFGKSATMDRFSTAFLSKDLFNDPHTSDCAETLLGLHLAREGIITSDISEVKGKSGGAPIVLEYPDRFNIDHLTAYRGTSWRQHLRIRNDSGPDANWRGIKY